MMRPTQFGQVPLKQLQRGMLLTDSQTRTKDYQVVDILPKDQAVSFLSGHLPQEGQPITASALGNCDPRRPNPSTVPEQRGNQVVLLYAQNGIPAWETPTLLAIPINEQTGLPGYDPKLTLFA